MGYLLAALVIVLAIVVAVAIAKLLIALLAIAAGLVAAGYLWYRLRDPGSRPNPLPSAERQRPTR